MGTPTSPTPTTYPKKLSISLNMEIEVYAPEEEHYFTSPTYDESYVADLREFFFNQVSNARLISANGIKVPLS